MTTVEIVVPVPAAPSTQARVRTITPVSVAGEAVAILDVGWSSMGRLAPILERDLRMAYGVIDVFHYRHETSYPLQPQFYDEIAARVAGAITGIGN